MIYNISLCSIHMIEALGAWLKSIQKQYFIVTFYDYICYLLDFEKSETWNSNKQKLLLSLSQINSPVHKTSFIITAIRKLNFKWHVLSLKVAEICACVVIHAKVLSGSVLSNVNWITLCWWSCFSIVINWYKFAALLLWKNGCVLLGL